MEEFFGGRESFTESEKDFALNGHFKTGH